MEERTKDPGVAIGLAWTPAGGEVLFIEASRMAGTGSLTLTGQLGDVMKESVEAARTVVRSRSRRLGIKDELFEKRDVHVHVPDGATLTDGVHTFVATADAHTASVTGWDLASLVLLPPSGYSGSVSLSVTATATDSVTGQAATSTTTMDLTVLGGSAVGGIRHDRHVDGEPSMLDRVDVDARRLEAGRRRRIAADRKVEPRADADQQICLLPQLEAADRAQRQRMA